MQTQEIEMAELDSLEDSRYIQSSSTRLAAKSVYAHTVEMSDDSMAPRFVKGDLLTINQMLIERPGDYVLVHSGSDDLSVIRRYTTIGDRANYVPENPAYPEMLELDYWGPECLGPVTAVQHVDGSIETFDLSTRKKAEAF